MIDSWEDEGSGSGAAEGPAASETWDERPGGVSPEAPVAARAARPRRERAGTAGWSHAAGAEIETWPTHELARFVAAVPRGNAGAGWDGRDWLALSRRPARQLARELALPPASAARLCAAFELGRRIERSTRAPRPALRSPALVHEWMAPELRGLERETFHVLLLDGKHRLTARHRISEGTLTSSLVHPREVFAPAVRECAAAVIVVHNHPSGDPEPSPEDVAVTRRLIDAGNLLGIPLLDHVVVAGDRHASLRERVRFDA